MQEERGCTTTDLLGASLRLVGASLKGGFASARIRGTTPRPPARLQGATRRVVWMTPRPQGRP